MEFVDLKPCGEGMVPSERLPIVANSRFKSETVKTLVFDLVVGAIITCRKGSEAAALLSPAFAGHVGEPCFYREIGPGLDVVLQVGRDGVAGEGEVIVGSGDLVGVFAPVGEGEAAGFAVRFLVEIDGEHEAGVFGEGLG